MKKPTLKRHFIYYLGTLILMVLFISGYALFEQLVNDVPFATSLQRLWIVPPLVVTLLFAYEFILGGIVFSKNPKRNEKNYVLHVSSVAKETLDLGIEDFETLRANNDFQESLRNIYQLFQEKNTHEPAYLEALKPFKKESLGYQVLEIIIQETRFLLNEPKPDS